MVDAAREQAAGLSDISFQQGDATATGLPPASADIVFQRALIHHLKDYTAVLRRSAPRARARWKP